ncbi:unnamed protein product [Didymodactylos carnosus]|uniref:ADP ribosyltransferase domain-containing protein n=1 Tax=Didymodactylos carnosus TaxID=1234261 RepID=A0A813VUT2_9BILA|nr:unnamed protein product [Didymodactylos carnosus]CAF3634400.1 unnamed protein product [Didymodactylos carnosus]
MRGFNSTQNTNKHMQLQLHYLTDSLKVFDNVDECEQCIIHTLDNKIILIVSVKEQLKLSEENLTVYRGQGLSQDELNKMKSSQHEFILMNSFLSTSKVRDVAVLYAKAIDFTNKTLQPVLFEFNIHAERQNAKPYAAISDLSYYELEEREVLFMLGSLFRIENVLHNEQEQIWIIKLSLCGSQQNNELFDLMRKDFGEYFNLLSFANLLKNMGEYGKSEHYYKRFLNEHSPNDDSQLPQCYYGFATIAFHKEEYNSSLELFNTILDLEKNDFSPMTADIYNWIGNIGFNKGDYNWALEHYEKALRLKMKMSNVDQLSVATIHGNIGGIHQINKSYAATLYQKF